MHNANKVQYILLHGDENILYKVSGEINFYQIFSKLFLSISLLMSIKQVLYFLDNIKGSLVKSFEISEMGNKKNKNTMHNKIEGIIMPNMRDNCIHPFSIILLKRSEIIPIIPKTKEVITAHCHEKARYRAKNPIEITNIVDFDVSFFIQYSFLL
jgi:hypothetical protein